MKTAPAVLSERRCRMPRVTVHAFVDESARADRYLIAAAIVDPVQATRGY